MENAQSPCSLASGQPLMLRSVWRFVEKRTVVLSSLITDRMMIFAWDWPTVLYSMTRLALTATLETVLAQVITYSRLHHLKL